MEPNNAEELQKKDPQPAAGEGVLDEYVDGYQQLEMQGYQANIRKARNWLLIAAGIYLASVFIQVGDVLEYIEPRFKIALFGFPALLVVLAILTPQKPVICLLLALILFISFYIGMAIWTEDIKWLYGGILIKGLVIASLIKGLKDAQEAEHLKKDYEARGGRP